MSQEAQEADHLAHRARLDLVYRVRRAWADLLLARENLALLGDQKRATRDIEELTRSRYAVGLAGQSDVLRAQAELARLDQMRFHELGAEESATAELNRLLVRPAGTAGPRGAATGRPRPEARCASPIARSFSRPRRDDAGRCRRNGACRALAGGPRLGPPGLKPDFMAGAST